jgi:hypothetical protein
MRIFALLTLLLFLPLASRAGTSSNGGAVTAVALQQDVCAFWGNCAHYIVAVNADGTGSYIGLEVASTKGSVPLNVPQSSFAAIVSQLNAMKYFALRDSYTSTDDGCKELNTDQTSVTFYAVRAGKVKRIEVYWGCVLPSVMGQFRKLADLINQVTGANKLIGADK